MEEQAKIEKLATSENFEAAADSVELKGKDGGKIGNFSQFEFYPNKQFNELSPDMQIQVVTDELNKVLYAHCDNIGWYPCQAPEISKNEKGVYRITAYLKRGTGRSAKFASELKAVGTVGINEK